MKVIENVSEFQDSIKNGIVIVDFFAEWCGPCRMMDNVLRKVEKELQNIPIIKVNVDSLPQLAMEYGVKGIPTIVIFQDGEEKDRIIGLVGVDTIKQKVVTVQGG